MSESKKILKHTADVRIKISAETLPELFLLGLKSLSQLLLTNNQENGFITEAIDLESPDTTALLIDFLSEALTLSQVHKAVFTDFKIDKMTDHKLRGTLTGSHVTEFDEDIKAVTYHEADVKVNDEGNWETVIIFDI